MKIAYTYWKESDGMFLGYLNEFPDYFLEVSQTMGETSWIRKFREWVRQQIT